MDKIVEGTLHAINIFAKDPATKVWKLLEDKEIAWEIKELDKIGKF